MIGSVKKPVDRQTAASPHLFICSPGGFPDSSSAVNIKQSQVFTLSHEVPAVALQDKKSA